MLSSIKNLGLSGWGVIAGILASVATVSALFIGGSGDNATPSQEATAPASREQALEAFGRQALEYFHAADWTSRWELFHPAIKELAPLDFYVKCQEDAGDPAVLRSLKFLGIGGTGIDMADIPEHSASVVSFRAALGTENVVTVQELELVLTQDDNNYLLPDSNDYDAYTKGRCPAGLELPEAERNKAPPTGEDVELP